MDLQSRFDRIAGRLFPDGETVLLAVSGGIDSMCMTDLFFHAGISIAVAHCNFHLRGEESDGDSQLVSSWCSDHGVPFYRADFHTDRYAGEKGESIEMAARELRYGWFNSLCLELGLSVVAVAHNANDNAETLILNILRGAGVKGMTGMREDGMLPVHGSGIRLVRPLLSFSRKEIAAHVAENSVPYRDDSTNAQTRYKRNKVRHLVFPVFEEINPSFLTALSRDMANLRQVSEIADEYYGGVRGRIVRFEDASCLRIDVAALRHSGHRDYIIYRLLEPYGFSISDVNSLSSLLTGEGTFSGKLFRAGEWKLVTSSSEIIVSKEMPHATLSSEIREGDRCIVVEGEGRYELGDVSFTVSIIPRQELTGLRQPQGITIADAAAFRLPFLVRGWKAGDWMCPLGLHGRKKLSDMFVDLKFSLPDKEKALVAVIPGVNPHEDTGSLRVAALLGYRIDESVKVKESTGKILVIRLDNK